MNIKISAKHEGASYPYWIIIDPRQNFKTNEDGIYNIARMITGIWFSGAKRIFIIKESKCVEQKSEYTVGLKPLCVPCFLKVIGCEKLSDFKNFEDKYLLTV